MSSNPVIVSVTAESGTAPFIVSPGQFSPWFNIVGTDADAQTFMADIKLKDSTGRESSSVTVGPFQFTDALSIASLIFPPNTGAQIDIDPTNPLRFRVKNTNV